MLYFFIRILPIVCIFYFYLIYFDSHSNAYYIGLHRRKSENDIRSIVSSVKVYWWKTVCVFHSFLLEHQQYTDVQHFGFMALWIHGTLDLWQFGFMALWIHGTLDSWHFVFMALWIQQFRFMAFYIH